MKEGHHFICADWYSRGDSCGEVMDATLTRWTSDIIRLLDECAPDVEGGTGGTKAILVGAGVGVWVAVLVAMQRPDLARGLVGIGGDPDFTEDLLWKELPEDVKDEIMTKGVKEITWGRLNAVYPITRSLIEDGRKNLVLRGGPGSLPIKCPVRLIHSINDEEVPVETSTKLAECVESQNCVISMPKVALKVPAINRAIEQCVEFTNI
jgi:pimeloyl-ACP methyl ester carboxylesterase